MSEEKKKSPVIDPQPAAQSAPGGSTQDPKGEPDSAKAEAEGEPAAAIKTPAQAGKARSATEAEEALRAFEQEQQSKEEQARQAEQEAREREAEAEAERLAARKPGMVRSFFRGFLQIRNEPSIWGKLIMSGLCLGLLLGLWWLTTREWWGPNGNERLLSKMAMGSPEEVFGSLGSLWFDRALMRNLAASLWRVLQGFGLAILVGVPLGILGGAFRRIDAFFLPISIFGRNVPIAALVPLTMLFFGIDEAQKVAFIFISCVAFMMFDASRAVAEVNDDYLDTAYTLGASRLQVLTKVLIPLAMPAIVNSLRLLLGLAFGYIILAEMVNAEFGVGKLILMSQRRGPKEHVYLVLLIITVVAFLVNYALALFQHWVFAWKYGRR